MREKETPGSETKERGKDRLPVAVKVESPLKKEAKRSDGLAEEVRPVTPDKDKSLSSPSPSAKSPVRLVTGTEKREPAHPLRKKGICAARLLWHTLEEGRAGAAEGRTKGGSGLLAQKGHLLDSTEFPKLHQGLQIVISGSLSVRSTTTSPTGILPEPLPQKESESVRGTLISTAQGLEKWHASKGSR